MTWKLARMLKTYKTCNLIVGFSKYEFYYKLLGGLTLLRVTPGVTWIQPYIYIHTFFLMYKYIITNMGTCPAIKQYLSALGSQALTDLSRRGGSPGSSLFLALHLCPTSPK